MARSDVVVFGGPSLPPDARLRWPDIVFAPPAAAGDILGLLRDPPRTVALIDGRFDSCASVWHKELLLLAATGTRVLGAASIGALRAVELDGLGMTGVGSIYRAYRCGLLTGDDEVALIHAPAEFGWRALTIPMVEVRAALCLGVRRKAWSIERAREIREEIHGIHFADRDTDALAHMFATRPRVLQLLLGLLEDPRVALKRRDAVQCIEIALEPPLERTAVPDIPLTCFVQDLAERMGVSLRVGRAPSPPTP